MKYQIWYTLRVLIVCAALVLLVRECNSAQKEDNKEVKLDSLQAKK